MISKQLDWGFIRSRADITYEGDDLEITYDLIEATSQDEEFGTCNPCNCAAVASRVAESGVFGDETCRSNVNKVWYLKLKMKANKPIVMPRTLIDFRVPLDNMQSLWLPSIMPNGKNYRPKGMLEYTTNFTTHICNLAPMGAFYSAEGLNKLSFALADCKNVVKVIGGSYQEEECGRITFELFAQPSHEMQEYETVIRFDSSLVPVYQAIENMSRFYERHLKLDVMPVPEAAREPVYSTWYSFLQNLDQQEIEDQCVQAAAAGCRTVIVDDGWQTDDNNRGYAFCGDWQLSKKRFPDMKGHVKRIHDLGMKYMIWFSVPFVGGKSVNGPEYKNYSLCFNPRWGAYVLDPRYKKVRDFLVTTFTNMVKEYDLDGLKLDFIDEFDMRQADEKALAPDPARTTESLPDAVDMLMTQIRASLEAVKSDILIEFRQNYVGPMIRKYGNMFRAHDCPNDTLMNRMTTIDVRGMALNTAVHSDMFIWSPTESVESASLNFIHTLFSVPQISCNFKHLNDEHKAMVKHWLSFYADNKHILQHGKLDAEHPELMFSLINARGPISECGCSCSCSAADAAANASTSASAGTGLKQITVVGTDMRVEVMDDELTEQVVINGAMVESLMLKHSAGAIALQATVFDCLGKQVSSSTITLDKAVSEIAVPKSGYIRLTRA